MSVRTENSFPDGAANVVFKKIQEIKNVLPSNAINAKPFMY